MEPRLHIAPEERMEESYRIPIFATLLFIVTMAAIYYLGRQVAGYYEPVLERGRVEFVDRT